MRDPVPQASGPAVRVFQLKDLRSVLEGRAARPDAIDAELLHCFGPRGNGIVAISGVSRAVELKRRLLDLAPRIASMPLAQLKELMKEQGVGSDVPLKKADRLVTSLACQLPCQSAEVTQGPSGLAEERIQAATISGLSGALDGAPRTAADDMAQLGPLMRDLAADLIGVTLLIAQLCDAALLRQLASRHQHPLTPSPLSGTSENASSSGLIPPTASQHHPNSPAAPDADATRMGDAKAPECADSRELPADDECLSSGTYLAEAIRQGGTAKARLIHYHALREAASQPCPKSSAVSSSAHAGHPELPGEDGSPPCLLSPHRLWQQWHYDYGLFTALVAPAYRHGDAADGAMDAPCSAGDEAQANTGSGSPAFSCRCPSGVCGSEVAAPSEEGSCQQGVKAPLWGLHVLCRQCKRLLRVEVPPDCVAIQVGESAQILSGGKLHAPLHCVLRAPSLSEGSSGSGPAPDDWSRQSFVVFVQPSWNRVLGHPMPEQDEHSLAHIVSDDHSDSMLCQGEATRFGQSSVPSLRCRWQPGMTFSEFAKATTRAYYGAGGLQPNRI